MLEGRLHSIALCLEGMLDNIAKLVILDVDLLEQPSQWGVGGGD